MRNKGAATLLVVAGILASAYGGHRAILWGEGRVQGYKHKIACQELNGWLETGKLEGVEKVSSKNKASDKFNSFMAIIETQCWSKH
jgi:hypothetical protein